MLCNDYTICVVLKVLKVSVYQDLCKALEWIDTPIRWTDTFCSFSAHTYSVFSWKNSDKLNSVMQKSEVLILAHIAFFQKSFFHKYENDME